MGTAAPGCPGGAKLRSKSRCGSPPRRRLFNSRQQNGCLQQFAAKWRIAPLLQSTRQLLFHFRPPQPIDDLLPLLPAIRPITATRARRIGHTVQNYHLGQIAMRIERRCSQPLIEVRRQVVFRLRKRAKASHMLRLSVRSGQSPIWQSRRPGHSLKSRFVLQPAMYARKLHRMMRRSACETRIGDLLQNRRSPALTTQRCAA